MDLEFRWNQVRKLSFFIFWEWAYSANWFIDAIDAEFADADAVLLLENAKVLNYVNENRRYGFDTETTFAVLNVKVFKAILIVVWIESSIISSVFVFFFLYFC